MNLGSGALIDVQSGAMFLNGGWFAFTWTNNLASMNVNGTLNLHNGNAVLVDALTGSGLLTIGNSGYASSLTAGVNGGSGTFSGIIQNGLGTVSLTKTGSGVQTLSGTNTFTGAINVSGGSLVLTSSGVFAANANSFPVAAPSGATLENYGIINTLSGGFRIGTATTTMTTAAGTLFLGGGAITASNDTTVGWANNPGAGVATGYFYQTGGTFTQSGGDFYVGVRTTSGTATGTYSISGGTMTAASGKNFLLGGGATGAATGTLNIGGNASVTVPRTSPPTTPPLLPSTWAVAPSPHPLGPRPPAPRPP